MEAFRNTAACSHAITGEEGAASVLNIPRQALMWNWSSKGCLLGPSCSSGLPVDSVREAMFAAQGGSSLSLCLLGHTNVCCTPKTAGKLLLPSVTVTAARQPGWLCPAAVLPPSLPPSFSFSPPHPSLLLKTCVPGVQPLQRSLRPCPTRLCSLRGCLNADAVRREIRTQVVGTGWWFMMDPLFPAHILEDPDLRKLLNDSSMLNLSFLPSNWFNNGTGDSFLPLSIKITIVVVYSIVCIVGLVGNCSVMYVIVRFTKMKTATNIYIFNLALADTLCLMTLPFQGTDTFLGFWPFGNVLCKIVISIDYYNMFTSTFTLTMMSVDRYIAICHPIKALDIRTPHKAKVVNVCIWALASVFGIPAMVMGSAENENNEIDCLIKLPSPVDYWDPVFGICVFLFSFMIPVLIITICYSLMIIRLKSVRLLSGSKEKDRNLRRITRMVLVVVAVFIICWTPIQIFVLVQCLGAKAESELELAISCFCTALGYANSSLNPVLYAFLDENFKACFKKFCFPTAFRTELQMSNRMCSIAKDVAYACKNSEGTNNPA
ncbi:nociceptin receptor isoform X1 [Coturnix japonica]|nr:nociceptin receptor isoform X1 [Coturnix japonica]